MLGELAAIHTLEYPRGVGCRSTVLLALAGIGAQACTLGLSGIGVDAGGGMDAAVEDGGAADGGAGTDGGAADSGPASGDAGTDAGPPGDAGPACRQHTIGACESSHGDIPSCELLFDGMETAPRCPTRDRLTLDCGGIPKSYCDYGPSCTDIAGCIRNVWFRFDLGAPATVSQVRFLAGWWADRPADYEIWYTDSPTARPGFGADRAFMGNAATNPWRCVEGEPCTDEVPDGCCPDGRDQPQVTDQTGYTPSCDLGEFFPKFNVASFPPATARYWYFVVRDGVYDDRVFLYEVELRDGCA